MLVHPRSAMRQAEIDVVEIDRQVLGIEPADGLEFRSLDRHAGAGHRGDLVRHRELIQVSAMVFRQTPIDMPGNTAKPEHDARMLQAPIGK